MKLAPLRLGVDDAGIEQAGGGGGRQGPTIGPLIWTREGSLIATVHRNIDIFNDTGGTLHALSEHAVSNNESQ